MQDLHLLHSWDNFQVDFTHLSADNDGVSRSATLDHIFWDEVLHNNILDAGVFHSPDNFSDHSPIYCVVKSDISLDKEPVSKAVVSKPKWSLASSEEKEEFKRSLNSKLASLKIPEDIISCKDVHCTNEVHLQHLDIFMASILEIVEFAAFDTLPVAVPSAQQTKKRKTTSGWNSLVQPFREKALFWHEVWKSAGKPLNCELHTVMKRSRNVYH